MEIKDKDILRVILKIAKSLKHQGLMLNERYLHHFFSYLMQTECEMLNLAGDRKEIILHPEWPTYKKQTGLNYGRYKRRERKYMPDPDGTAGFIDFAIGNYQKPRIGIEFSLKYGWSNEEIVYDFVKLLDKTNPFRSAFSFNVILRHSGLARGSSLTRLENRINVAVNDAVSRLADGGVGVSRGIHFMITEIGRDDKRRHWFCRKATEGFHRSLPSVN